MQLEAYPSFRDANGVPHPATEAQLIEEPTAAELEQFTEPEQTRYDLENINSALLTSIARPGLRGFKARFESGHRRDHRAAERCPASAMSASNRGSACSDSSSGSVRSSS